MLENTKEVYIDKNNKLVKIEVNQKPMIIKVPVFSKQSRQKPKIALLRIGESPSKIPSFTSTNFEKEFPQTENTREIEAQNKIKNIRATLENELSESNFSKIITDIYKVCSDYPDISYICAMAKLYYAEAYLKTNQDKEAADIDCEMKMLCEQIIEEYKPFNTDLLKSVISKIEERKDSTQGIIDEKKIKIEAKLENYTKEVEVLYKKLEEAKLGTYQEIWLFESYYSDLYKKIADSLDIATSGVLNNENTRKLFSQLHEVHNQAPFDIKILVYEGQFPYGHYVEKKVTFDPKKARIGSYTNAFGAAVINDGKYRKFNNDYMTYDDLKNKIFDYYNMPIPPNSGDAIEELYYRNRQISQHYIVSEINTLYFTLNEMNTINFEEVYPVKTNFSIRAKFPDVFDNYKVKEAYYTFNVTAESKISQRHKTLKMRPDLFYGVCSAKFIPNETDDPKDEKMNLINNEKDALKESVAATCGETEALSVPPAVYNNSYFKYRLGYSNPDGKKTFKNSASFFKSGGAEYLTVTSNNHEAKTLIRNQANWFIFTGHGNPNTGTIGEYIGTIGDVNYNPNAVLIRPGKDQLDVSSNTIVPGLIKENGISEYSENMDVLILSACGVLNSLSNVKKWHKVFPDGVILGYSGDIENLTANNFNTRFNNFLKDNIGKSLTKIEVAAEWEKLNLKIYNEYKSWMWPFSKLRSTGNYAYIINNEWHFGSIITTIGTFRNGENLVEFVLSPIE